MPFRGTISSLAIRTWIAAAASLLLVAGLAPGSSAARAQDLSQRLEQAREEQERLQRRLDDAATRIAKLESRAGRLSNERDALAARVASLRRDVSAAEERIESNVRSLYMRNGFDPMLALLSSENPGDGPDRAAIVRSLVRGERATSEEASAKRESAAAVIERLREQQAALDETLREHEEATAALRADLERAAEVEAELEAEKQRREEEARRRREAAARAAAAEEQVDEAEEVEESASSVSTSSTSSAPVSSGYACPIGSPRSYTDTWGAPRGGGRSHRGTDILSPYGTPIYAVTSGRVDLRGYGSSAGYWIIFYGDDGDQYWYMHLQSYTVSDGAHVSAGQQIGTNGDTGNARGTPHLHFERHPGGGGAVNPYPFVYAACG